MSLESKINKDGVKPWRFDKTVRRVRLKSMFLYTSKRDAAVAQAEAVTAYVKTGQIITTPTESDLGDLTILEFMTKRLDYLKDHKSPAHYRDTRWLFKTVLAKAPKWKTMPVKALTAEMVRRVFEAWYQELKKRDVSAKQINNARAALQVCWSHPWDSQRAPRTLEYNPFKMIDDYPVSKKKRYVPPTVHVENLLAAVKDGDDEDLYLYILILATLGARPAEPLKMTWEDVAFERNIVTLWTKKKKGGKETPRSLEAPRELMEKLQERKDKRPDSKYVFQQRNAIKPRPSGALSKAVIQLSRTLFEKKIEPYALRHWRASRWSEQGVPLATISKRLGHDMSTTTDIYMHSLRGV